MLPQPSAAGRDLIAEIDNRGPEGKVMATVRKMRKFVRDNVFEHPGWRQDQPPAER